MATSRIAELEAQLAAAREALATADDLIVHYIDWDDVDPSRDADYEVSRKRHEAARAQIQGGTVMRDARSEALKREKAAALGLIEGQREVITELEAKLTAQGWNGAEIAAGIARIAELERHLDTAANESVMLTDRIAELEAQLAAAREALADLIETVDAMADLTNCGTADAALAAARAQIQGGR